MPIAIDSLRPIEVTEIRVGDVVQYQLPSGVRFGTIVPTSRPIPSGHVLVKRTNHRDVDNVARTSVRAAWRSALAD